MQPEPANDNGPPPGPVIRWQDIAPLPIRYEPGCMCHPDNLRLVGCRCHHDEDEFQLPEESAE